MLEFTTRPEIRGTFGAVATTHWIASAVAMSVLERGGNAFDAAAAAGFVLQIVEPHLVGPGGEVPIILKRADAPEPIVICGRDRIRRPQRRSALRRSDSKQVPGTGLLPSVVPGAFDAWMLLLRDMARWRLADILEPAIGYAENGFPVLPRVASSILAAKDFFANEWPSSAAVWLPHGEVPRPRTLHRTPDIAATYRRIVAEAQSVGADRDAQIEKARDTYYRGFVAEAIDRFYRTAEVMDFTGRRNGGCFGPKIWRATAPARSPPCRAAIATSSSTKPVHGDRGRCCCRRSLCSKVLISTPWSPRVTASCTPWSNASSSAMRIAKCSTAIRISSTCRWQRCCLTTTRRRAASSSTDVASVDMRPGELPGAAERMRGSWRWPARKRRPISATVSRHSRRCRSNGATPCTSTWSTASATCWQRRLRAAGCRVLRWCPVLASRSRPEARWVGLSPVIRPPSGPGARPRTTLTPTLVTRDGEGYLAMGTPGGDQQDQWVLAVLLRHLHHGLDLQASIDMPLFTSRHFPQSFYPRTIEPNRLLVEERFGEATIASSAASRTRCARARSLVARARVRGRAEGRHGHRRGDAAPDAGLCDRPIADFHVDRARAGFFGIML